MARENQKRTVDSYRSIPFWSWNDKLEKEELIRQIRWMKDQGFGGYLCTLEVG